MLVIKKIVSFYQYVYYRLYLFHRKQWDEWGNSSDRIALLGCNSAISASAVSFVLCIDFLFERFTGSDFFFDNIYRILGIVILVVIVQTIILREDEKSLEYKYSRKKDESNSVWQLKGFFSLLFVYGPIALLIFLM